MSFNFLLKFSLLDVLRWYILGRIMPSPLFFWQAGAFLGFSGIVLGAYGSHGLQKHITDQTKIKNWQIATNYQIMHSVVLLVLSSINNPKTGKPATLASGLVLAGTTLFSGTIYLLVLNRNRFKFLGPVTPIGGLILLAGWGSLLL